MQVGARIRELTTSDLSPLTAACFVFIERTQGEAGPQDLRAFCARAPYVRAVDDSLAPHCAIVCHKRAQERS